MLPTGIMLLVGAALCSPGAVGCRRGRRWPLFPRRGLLVGGVALVSAALHWIVGSAMLSYLVHCCCT